MKRKVSIFCTFFLLVAGGVSAQMKKEMNTIVFKGTAYNYYNGSTLVIYNKAMDTHDSVQVEHGEFELSVPYKGPSRYMFYSKYELKQKGGYAPYGILISEPGIIHINADMQTLSNSVISGALENDYYTGFTRNGNAGRQKINDQLIAKFGTDVFNKLKLKNQQNDLLLKYYKDLDDENNELEVQRLKTFIAMHKNSFAAIYALNNLAGKISAVNAQMLYDALGEKYKKDSYGQNIINAIGAMKLTAMGNIAPDFQQANTEGKLVKLSSFRGQYVLLDFWASWCMPCREENPNLVKAYHQFHEKGFTVLGVSLDQPGKKDAWLNAIQQDGLIWTQVSDLKFWNNAVAKLYGIQSVPQNFLLDKEGKIIGINLQGDALIAKLEEIFGQ